MSKPATKSHDFELIDEAEAATARLDSEALETAWRTLERIAPVLVEKARDWPPEAAVRAVIAVQEWLVRTGDHASRERHLLWALDVAERTHLRAAEIRRALVRCAFMRGEFARARQWIEHARREGDDSGALDRLRLHVAIRTGGYEEAEAILERLVPIESMRAWDALHRALLATKLGHYADAEATLAALRREAERQARRLTLGHIDLFSSELAVAQGRHEEVLALVDSCAARLEVLAAEPFPTIMAARRANALFGLGRIDEARKNAAWAWDTANRLGLAEPALEAAVVLLLLARHDGRSDDVEVEQVRRWLPVAARATVVTRAEKLLRDRRRGLQIDASGAAFEIDGVRTDLRRRRALGRILAALAASNGRPLGIDELFEAGWPAERIHPESVRRRVYTAIWSLRRAGLGPWLAHVADGYTLEGAWTRQPPTNGR